MQNSWLIAICAVLLTLTAPCVPSWAQESPASPEHPDPTQENPEHTPEKESPDFLEHGYRLIGSTFETLQHRRVSQSIEDLSQYLDSFYGDPRFYEEITKSYASLRVRSVYARAGTTDFDARFKLRLDLPRTENRLKFRLDFNEDEDTFEDLTEDTKIERSTEEEETTINTSVQYIIQETRNWTVSLSGGGKVRDPIDVYVKLRLRRSLSLFDWKIRLVQAFEWFHSKSYGSKTSLYLDKRLGEKTLLRFSSQAYRNEEEFIHRNFEISQRITLFHALNDREVLSTEAGIFADTEPVWHHDSYYWNVNFRRDIHKGFVFLDIRPQVSFLHENNFHGEGSITLSLEVLYGGRYLGY